MKHEDLVRKKIIEKAENGVKQMKCPFCNTEMLHGYLNSGSVIWSVKENFLSTQPDWKEKYAFHLGTSSFIPHQTESFCCPKCKKLIIDVSPYRNNLDE